MPLQVKSHQWRSRHRPCGLYAFVWVKHM